MMVAACIDFSKYYCCSFPIGLFEAVRIFYTWTIISLTRDYPNLISLNYYSVLLGYHYDCCAVLNCGSEVIAETGEPYILYGAHMFLCKTLDSAYRLSKNRSDE
jgi:hypothetical protein